MDFQQLEVLEEKIKKLLSTVKSAQLENERLTRKNEDNEKTIKQLKHDLEKWSRSADENESLAQQIDTLKKERDEIGSRLERLISHLQEIETKL